MFPNQQQQNENPEAVLREGDSAPAIGSPKADSLDTAVPETLLTEDMVSKGKSKKANMDFLTKLGRISVKPYIDANYENMGLEDYNYAVFPGTSQVEQLAAIEINGVIRYITGLDEFAPEVINIMDPDKKAAVIRNIRSIVIDLEKRLASNVIQIDDEEFWSKVKLLRPDNHEYWEKITIKCSNEPLFLDPKNKPTDLLIMMAIEAGGFDLVAKSYDDAKAMAQSPKFYLDKEAETVSSRTEGIKLRNKALSILDGLYGKNPKKLLYVTKVVVGSDSTQYKNSTPVDVLYEVLDTYIHGRGVETSKTRAANSFMNTTQFDMETLKLKAIVKDASIYGIIVHKSDGMLYHAKKSAMMGRNVADIVEFLKNPMNEDVLTDVLTQVEQYWNQ